MNGSVFGDKPQVTGLAVQFSLLVDELKEHPSAYINWWHVRNATLTKNRRLQYWISRLGFAAYR